MERPRICVVIVDDFEPFRRFLCSNLKKRADLEIICEASDGLAAVQKAEELQPDLILLDMGLPKLNGIEAAHRIARVAPNAKIVMVTQNGDASSIRSALSDGVRGYVLKSDAGDEILKAIDAVLANQTFVSSALLARVPLDDIPARE